MNLPFLSRKPRARTYPQPDVTDVSVSVTPSERGRTVIDNEPAPLEFTRDPATIKQIRDNLPNAPSANLIAARHAAVLNRYADFLEGKAPAPELGELIASCRFAAEHIRDGIVIGGAQ